MSDRMYTTFTGFVTPGTAIELDPPHGRRPTYVLEFGTSAVCLHFDSADGLRRLRDLIDETLSE